MISIEKYFMKGFYAYCNNYKKIPQNFGTK